MRLTKKRIEAATPITMAEFRADKDQLRAEFALSTRRLEMHVEALRRRLSDQLRDINRKRNEVGAIRDERETQLTADPRTRRARRRNCAAASSISRRKAPISRSACACATANMRTNPPSSKPRAKPCAARRPRSIDVDGKALSGDYNTDMDVLLQKLEAERKRATFVETQNRSLIAQLENSDKRSADAASAAAELRAALSRKEDAATEAQDALVEAEVKRRRSRDACRDGAHRHRQGGREHRRPARTIARRKAGDRG